MSMTTELIERLRQHADTFEKSGFAVDGLVKDYREAADTIQILSENLHYSQTKPCEDAISRKAAISVANDFGCGMVVRGLEKLPSVQPEQKTGKWLGTDEWYHKCSCCGEVFHFYYPEYTKLNKWNFCPRCGAKMESEDKE